MDVDDSAQFPLVNQEELSSLPPQNKYSINLQPNNKSQDDFDTEKISIKDITMDKNTIYKNYTKEANENKTQIKEVKDIKLNDNKTIVENDCCSSVLVTKNCDIKTPTNTNSKPISNSETIIKKEKAKDTKCCCIII